MNLYYGINDIPKNKTRATEQEAIDNNKVNYWGLCAVDPQLLKNHTENKKKQPKEQNDSDATKKTRLEKKLEKLAKLKLKVDQIETEIAIEQQIKKTKENKDMKTKVEELKETPLPKTESKTESKTKSKSKKDLNK